MMSKKLIKQTNYNVGIVESYKATDKSHNIESPIVGSFSVKGMTVENAISQNRTKYSGEVWAQPTAFGKGGKFIDESGKLRPSTLFGSVDHPIDDRAELLLNEAAIAWYEVKRNDDGSWDGSADILNNPQGRIVKTFLEYAKMRGGGHLLGVSSRALGESMLSESSDGQYEAIVPESFELMSFDFVYNPSFQTAVASLNESKKGSKKSLTESIKALAKEDEEHADIYNKVAESLEKEEKQMKKTFEGKTIEKAKAAYLKELKDKEHELHNALYEIDNMDEEEFKKAYDGDKEKIMSAMQAEYREVLEELNNLKKAETKVENIEEPKVETVEESKEVINEENKTVKDFVDEAKEKELELFDDEESDEESDEETDEESEENNEESEEDLEELEIEDEESEEEIEEEEELSLEEEVKQLKDMVQQLLDYLMPVEDPETEIEDLDDADTELLDDPDLENEESDEETEESEEDLAEDLDISEEELDELSDEELEYLLNSVED